MVPRKQSPPDSLDTLLEQAQALQDEGDYRRAIMCYRRAQALAPFRQEIRTLLAEAIDGLLMTPSADLSADFSGTDFTDTRERKPTGRRTRRGKRRTLWKFGLTLGIMIAVFTAAVVLAVTLRRMGESPGLATSSRLGGDGAETPTASVEELIEEARGALAISQFEDALANLDEAMALDPEDSTEIQTLYSEIHLMRGREQFNRGRYERALRDCRRAADYDPENAEAFYSIGFCHFYMGRDERNAGDEDSALEHYRDGAEAFRQSVALETSLAKSHRGLAEALYQLGDRAGAFESWRQTITANPDSRAANLARQSLQSHGMPLPES